MATRQVHGTRLIKPDNRNREIGGKPTALSSSLWMAPSISSGSKLAPNTTISTSRPIARRTDTGASDPSRPSPETVKPATSKLPRSINAPSTLSVTTSVGKAATSTNRSMALGIRTDSRDIGRSSPGSKPRQSNLLRRKASSSDNHVQYARSESIPTSQDQGPQQTKLETVSSPGGYTDPFPGSVLGISLPTISTSTSHLPISKAPLFAQGTFSSPTAAAVISRRLPHKTSTHELAQPTPGFAARSSSASTRCSESPGPFSRTSTPTSISSHSPGISHPPKFVSRLKPPHGSISSRPPVTHYRVDGDLDKNDKGDTQGLPVLRESVTSSSSSSTIRAVERIEETETATVANDRLPTIPPSFLPMRASSKRLPNPRTISSPNLEIPTAEDNLSALPTSSRVAGGALQKISRKSSVGDGNQHKAPLRPSRDGAPSLDNASGVSPVIQSNLNQLPTSGHTRRESAEKAAIAQRVANPVSVDTRPTVTRTLSSSSKPSRSFTKLPSPRAGQLKDLPPSAPAVGTARAIPRLQTNLPIKSRNIEPSPQSGSSAKSTKRFGLFPRPTRPTKPPVEINSPPITTDRNKGPAAGTGHEGYGKYAKRGRSGSISSVSSRGRSLSSTRPSSGRKSSFASQEDSELDDFYKDRLAPVVIGGGGRVLVNQSSDRDFYNTNNVGGSTDSIDSRPSHTVVSPNDIKSTALSPQPDTTTRTALRDGRRLIAGQRNGVIQPMVDTDNNIGGSSDIPSLAMRRSLYRSHMLKEVEPRHLPPPINTDALTTSPSLDSHETFQSSIPATNSTTSLTDDISEGREGNWLKPKPKKRLDRIKLPSKWNFFQRAQQSPRKLEIPDSVDKPEDVTKLPASISKVSEPRTVAHYAILDESEEDTPGTWDEKLREIEEDLGLVKNSTSRSQNSSELDVPKQTQFEPEKRQWTPYEQDTTRQYQSDQSLLGPNVLDQERQASILPPPPPVLAEGFPRQLQSPLLEAATIRQEAKSQPKRLIAAPAFKGSRLPQVGRIPKVISKRDRLYKPSPQSFSRPFLKKKPSIAEPRDFTVSASVDVSNERLVQQVRSEDPVATRFAELDLGQATTTSLLYDLPIKSTSGKEFLVIPPQQDSETSGSSSSGVLDFTAITAIPPMSEAIPTEDEIWNEYDELLDQVASPGMLPDYSSGDRRPSNLSQQHQTSSGAPKKESLILGSSRVSRSTTSSGTFQKEFNLTRTNRSSESTISAASPRLQLPPASQPPLVSELPSLPNSGTMPSTPLSFSDFFAGYGDRSSSIPSMIRQTWSSESRYSSRSTNSKSESRSSQGSDHEKKYRQLTDQRTAIADAYTKLRFSAVRTSRWLSFNRVLFSPAQEEIESSRQDRILVLDGLRNDDWSSYCALTYPDAVIYNLGSGGPMSTRKRESINHRLPSNHRQIHHAGFAHPFPFPKGFFTVVVFRFPIASAESAYYNAISESKRVLRPGGYLELSVLDIDMVNMGNRARRAIRALKTKMQIAEPSVCLSPSSDVFQKMLGRRGFENLNRCMVGVPVAGSISDSRAGSLDEKDFSLHDMLKVNSTQGDVPITKMVAKVGRWWWSRCYEFRSTDATEEREIEPEQSEDSIWKDKALLKECEKRETGFKLLICYAQKPSNPRRRTVSV